MSTSSQPIATSNTGGFSFAQLLLIVAGLALISIQIVILIGGNDDAASGSGLSRYLSGVLGIFILLMAFLVWGRRGKLSLHTDRITGRTAQGKTYDIPLSDLEQPDLNQSSLLLKRKTDIQPLRDRLPQDPQILGTLWLMLAHPQLPVSFWQTFAATPSEGFAPALRHFLDPNAKTALLDGGFVTTGHSTPYYFPATDTQLPPQNLEKANRLSTNVLPQGMLLRFEPNPAKLPLARFIKTLFAHPLPELPLDTFLDQLAADHAGCPLKPVKQGIWKGRCMGMTVGVITDPDRIAMPKASWNIGEHLDNAVDFLTD